MVKSKNKTNHKFIKFIRLVFIPDQSNSYRPYFIRRYSLVFIVIMIIGIYFGFTGRLSGDGLNSNSSITINRLLNKTNQTRVDYGLEPLVLSQKLNQAAELKVSDMINNQYWAHTSPLGVQPWHWFDVVDYRYSEAGENLARDFYNTDTVMLAWMNSLGHRDNILYETYQEVGFAVANGKIKGEPTSIIVALYARPTQELATGPNSRFIQPESNIKNNVLTRLNIAIRSITVLTLFGLIIVFIAIIVSGSAHANRKKLMGKYRKIIYRYHGLIKVGILLLLAALLIWAYGSGQIL